MELVPYEIVQPLHAFLHRTCQLMNEERWAEFLQLCDADRFRYRVVNYSPEIRREQSWADRDYASMKSAFQLLPRHNSDHSKLTRHAIVQNVHREPGEDVATLTSCLTVYRTQLDGTMSYLESGQTSLYAIGTYQDVVGLDGESVRLRERTVRLDTRQLDVGSHKPF